ncbi:hypothetical protein TREES_T100010471 [Tupaia chinensis]|uniref:Uncharacterized protein n=1 Tax=Tupaia chinensis TaxID=246437 RepID=L9LAY6_TUPCH|nr:hypothetical protein TREES_T100010471 [Tupaia chinensis]
MAGRAQVPVRVAGRAQVPVRMAGRAQVPVRVAGWGSGPAGLRARSGPSLNPLPWPALLLGAAPQGSEGTRRAFVQAAGNGCGSDCLQAGYRQQTRHTRLILIAALVISPPSRTVGVNEGLIGKSAPALRGPNYSSLNPTPAYSLMGYVSL